MNIASAITFAHVFSIGLICIVEVAILKSLSGSVAHFLVKQRSHVIDIFVSLADTQTLSRHHRL